MLARYCYVVSVAEKVVSTYRICTCRMMFIQMFKSQNQIGKKWGFQSLANGLNTFLLWKIKLVSSMFVVHYAIYTISKVWKFVLEVVITHELLNTNSFTMREQTKRCKRDINTHTFQDGPKFVVNKWKPCFNKFPMTISTSN